MKKELLWSILMINIILTILGIYFSAISHFDFFHDSDKDILLPYYIGGQSQIHKNAIVVLTRGYTNFKGYNTFIKRTKSIARQPWAVNYDHIVFHEGNISASDQEKLKKVCKIPLQFINIATLFTKYKRSTPLKNNLCPSTKLSDKFNIGYKTMCAFWFIHIGDFLSEYNGILRIDEDCILDKIVSDPNPGMTVALATVKYYGMDSASVIVGMNDFFSKIAKTDTKYGFQWTSPTWDSPYTNVLWLSIPWVNSEPISYIRKKVYSSNCVLHNRWGDLPLWGATLALTKTPKKYLNFYYYHQSHDTLVKTNK